MVANAASSTIWLGTNTSNNIGQNATDPHGGIWLKGTTDGTTAGPMDTSLVAPAAGTITGQPAAGTAPAGWSFGHIWETDVPSGFCRVDTVNDVNNAGATIQLYARPNAYSGAPAAGGCITAGQKASQPIIDPRRNANGTFYVYTCDWAVFSQGCYRMTYDPGAQIMTNVESLAPGRFPTGGGRGIKPFSTDMGADGNLYVTSDLLPYIYRISSPNDPNTGNQTVSIVSTSNDNSRIRASTFACWDPHRGGTTGLPTCAQSAAAGNPAPDLVLTQKTKVTVLMDVTNCVGVPVDVNGTGGPSGALPGCLPLDTDIRVLTPMGAQTQGGWNLITGPTGLPTWGPALDPNTIYITDSPGATSQIVRYTINKDTQDSYSNFGVFPDGTTVQYSFGFSPTQSPDGRMFLGDDPSAGASSGNGHIWMIPAGAPADVLGAPGAPATPPPPPSQKVGTIYGSGVSLPNDGVWLPGALGGHLWIADGAAGFCRMDANTAVGAPAPFALNSATCDITTTKPGQPAYDPNAQADGTHFVYLPDQSTKGQGVIRVKFNPTTETIVAGSGIPVAPGQGLENQKTAGAALNPVSGTLYLGFLGRNTTAPTEIARVHNPGSAAPTVDFVANVTRHKPIFTLDFVGQDLYVGNNGGLDVLTNADACAPGACASIQVLNTRGPRGMASDGVDKIYMAGPSIPAGCPPTCPAPGTLTTPVQVFTVSTGDFSTFSSQGVLSDGVTLSAYDVVDSITIDPAGNVYVADDPNVLGLPAGQGRVFKVPAASQEPVPAIISKPNSLTNQNKPFFAFQSADTAASFKCSLVALGAADSFANCGGTGAGNVTYGTDAAGNIVQNGANPLLDGPYVFRVEGISPAGVVSFPNSFGFRIDTVLPIVSITSQPVSPSNDNTPTFAFGADKASVSFSCALTLAGGTPAFNLCNSPATFGPVADGSYTFTVQGTDPSGNVGSASASLVVDTVAPTVSASPAGGIFTAPQSVVLTASEPATIFYTTDGTTPTTLSTSGASPVTVSIPGSATLKYFAKDLAGNVGAVASQVYQIGAVTITQNPPTLSNINTPTFAWTDTLAGATFQCSLVLQTGVDSFSPCTTPKTYTAQPDGAYRFVVKDQNGSSAQFLFTIDTTPPVVSLTQNPANPDQSNSALFAWTANEAVSGYQCSFGLQTAPDAFAACTSPVTESNLADGSYVFKVKGTDLAGNTSTPISYLFNVTAFAPPTATAPTQTLKALTMAVPSTSATTSAAGPITATAPTSSAAGGSAPVTISWTGTACQSGVTNCNIDHYVVQESINGAAFGPVTLASPTATSVTLGLKVSPTNNSTPATTYKFQVQAVDTLGNVSAFAIAPSFIVPDTDNSFNSSLNGSWSGVNLTGAFQGSVAESTTAGAVAGPANATQVTGFAVVSTLGPDRGKAQIKIDGQIVATIDLYSATQQTAQVVYAMNNLNPASTHTVQVVSTGTKNAASSAAKVDYDAILALH
jgi:chitobiase/beta-hexosaminidase-like protein